METRTDEWISVPQAALILGCGVPAARRLVADEKLTARHVPGSFARVLRSEVEALANASTVPARSA